MGTGGAQRTGSWGFTGMQRFDPPAAAPGAQGHWASLHPVVLELALSSEGKIMWAEGELGLWSSCLTAPWSPCSS